MITADGFRPILIDYFVEHYAKLGIMYENMLAKQLPGGDAALAGIYAQILCFLILTASFTSIFAPTFVPNFP